MPKFSLLLVNEGHKLCIYTWPYETKLARNNFYFEPILLGLFMGWQIRKKISFSFMSMRNSKFCGFTTTMDKCHYVMRKVLHNNIDSSRLSQEYDAAKYHSNVGRIEFNRTLMPQFSWMKGTAKVTSGRDSKLREQNYIGLLGKMVHYN